MRFVPGGHSPFVICATLLFGPKLSKKQRHSRIGATERQGEVGKQGVNGGKLPVAQKVQTTVTQWSIVSGRFASLDG